ncbi:MAG: nitroreductase family protein [Muribaculaceae bacterium]|nr:nitroreductase family protein [Muribaculaceae bacterium]
MITLSNEILENILTRTSVRRFSPEPVPEGDIDAILRAAMSAPTGVNRRPWFFYVVEDKDVLASLAGVLPYAKMAKDAPLAILVCGDSSRFLEGDDSTLWVQDVSAASENILLAAHALGLGGVWTCLYPHQDRMDAVRKLLDIPSALVPFNLIPIGYPAAPQKPMDKYSPDRIKRI